MARLWEDVIGLMSGAMESVPEGLLDVAAASPDWNWLERPEAEAASTWHGADYLYTSYLRVAPRIR
jgi:hypothetical protein